jgi:endonuclease III
LSVTNPHPALVKDLLTRHDQTYAEQAGIRLADKPSPLFELLVLALLLSTRISADIAVGAARELFAAGYRTPERMRDASWQDRVDALGRGHYRRYDESTASRLGDNSALLIQRWGGDLRQLRDEGGGEARQIRRLLTEFDGIGPTGADIFLREVQGVWPQVAPYLDTRARTGAERVGLPPNGDKLLALAGSPEQLARLASALVSESLS